MFSGNEVVAERSEAFVLRKTGGRQNVVQLRTLKRTRLASREHVGWNIDIYIYIYIAFEFSFELFSKS